MTRSGGSELLGKQNPDTVVAITPSDTEVLESFMFLYVGTSGDLTVSGAGGGKVLFKAYPAGSFLPVVVTQVWDSGTDATDLVGCY